MTITRRGFIKRALTTTAFVPSLPRLLEATRAGYKVGRGNAVAETAVELSFVWMCWYCRWPVVEPAHNRCPTCGESPHSHEVIRIKRRIHRWEIKNGRRVKDPSCLVYKQQIQDMGDAQCLTGGGA